MPVRAHRSSYLDRALCYRDRSGSLVDVLMVRPVDAKSARGVAEYLWFLDHRFSLCKVLSSYGSVSERSVLHTIFFVEQQLSLGFPYSDALALYRHDYRVDATTGTIAFRETFV